jgi:myo-inositol-1(or 4)-monophosphatase
MINIAIRAARSAGDVIMKAFDSSRPLEITPKGLHDYATQIDRQSEEAIIKVLHHAYPHHEILGEESGVTGQNPNYQWIIDPLDGTLNFIHGFPHFAVSIALRINQSIEHGVIYDPVRNELFTASRGQGAQLDNRRLRVKEMPGLSNAFLGTGFPTRFPEQLKPYTDLLQRFFEAGVVDIRRAGSAALDLAYVAAGRLDGFWETGLKAWDVAAGSLLISEAGGHVGDFSGGENHLHGQEIVAGHFKLYKAMLQQIQRFRG